MRNCEFVFIPFGSDFDSNYCKMVMELESRFLRNRNRLRIKLILSNSFPPFSLFETFSNSPLIP